MSLEKITTLERIVKGQREYIEELRELIKIQKEIIANQKVNISNCNKKRGNYKKPTHLKIV